MTCRAMTSSRYQVGEGGTGDGDDSIVEMGDVEYFQSSGIEFEEDEFGFYTDKKTSQRKSVRRFTWKNSNNISVQVITYGATVTSVKVPDKNGTIEDIVMGFNNIDGYLQPLNPYFGATVGRVANRIANGNFSIDGSVYNVSKNLGKNTLHGGFIGFDKVNWDYYVDGSKVVMSYLSPDNEEGFPGDLVVNVSFELTKDNDFIIDYKASTTKPTFVNLTNHSYFNLAGDAKGAQDLYKHVVSINADKITEVDEDSIPTGNFLPVGGTIFDLRVPKVLGDVINNIPGSPGYDHNFCITRTSKQTDSFVARVVHPSSGRTLEVYSNQPGVQFYTSNFIPEDPLSCKGDTSKLQTLVGKNGNYYKHGSFCLETQNYPDAINHKNFPKAILYPGETYYHRVVYKFFVEK